ncbi:hypothetical protein [Oerskovia enterophila]|uniref:Uncharacterized protein n=1 Tax=Oerskovia enterophila TaxID=43678 RepID=A0ABX2Y911_9CELL|nr:hypothetical protein [Oerskovia enterophila]OCI32707.1 hypothetical protein OERS_06380 [Oerskovia enterophila]
MSVENLIRDLHERILLGESGVSDLLGGTEPVPGWYGYALSDLALVIDDAAKIEFVDGATLGPGQESASAAHSARIVVFTTSLVVEIQGHQTDEGVGTHATTVRSRGGLVDAVVGAGRSATDHDVSGSRSPWPGHVRVELHYADGRTISLPLRSEARDFRYSERLRAYLPSLLNDLHRA